MSSASSGLAPFPKDVAGFADAAVVGAGPVGCVTALAFANRGARVVLLEAHPAAATRLAGEWLHPAAVGVLRRLGLPPMTGPSGPPSGRGFAVFPDDDTAPILLPYSEGATGLTSDHAALVGLLRGAVAEHPGIELLEFAHVTRVERARVTFERPGHPGATTVAARQVVGADGRASVVRRGLARGPDRTFVSATAGLLLDDVDLPFEGFGHLLLGGPGPVFIYRIGPRRVRACIDVPSYERVRHDPARYLWEEYGTALPGGLRAAFHHALEARPTAWAANQFRPRACYGREGQALVGDAVGHFHPLTAVGLTLGFLDAECLARSPSFEAYRAERSTRSHVPELMATALYEVFAMPDRGARALRRQMYRLLRADPRERERTMRLLAAEDTDVTGFSRPFLKILAMATERVVRDVVSPGRRPDTVPIVIFLLRRLAWLASHALIGALGPSRRLGVGRCTAVLDAFARRAAPTVARRAAAMPPMATEPRAAHAAPSLAGLDTRS